jgi:hypothetical protein
VYANAGCQAVRLAEVAGDHGGVYTAVLSLKMPVNFLGSRLRLQPRFLLPSCREALDKRQLDGLLDVFLAEIDTNNAR